MIKTGFSPSSMNEAAGDKDVAKLKKLLVREKEIEKIIHTKGFEGAMKYKDEYHKLLGEIGKLAQKIDGPGAIYGDGILAKLNKELNESIEMNEALKPAKVGWYGNSNPKLPDGTPELTGDNKVITVNVIKGDGPEDYAVVALMGDEGEHLLQMDKLKDKKEAVKLAEKLLKEVKDDMYDPKKVAKKYNMQYFNQE